MKDALAARFSSSLDMFASSGRYIVLLSFPRLLAASSCNVPQHSRWRLALRAHAPPFTRSNGARRSAIRKITLAQQKKLALHCCLCRSFQAGIIILRLPFGVSILKRFVGNHLGFMTFIAAERAYRRGTKNLAVWLTALRRRREQRSAIILHIFGRLASGAWHGRAGMLQRCVVSDSVVCLVVAGPAPRDLCWLRCVNRLRCCS